MPAEPVVTIDIYRRHDCHLCDVATAVVDRAASRADDVRVQTHEIDADSALHERYTDLVPVVTVDGIEVGHWHVAEDDVVAALERARAGRTDG